MMFISYAQNFEDVMLWRALKHIKNGFYIDIGAWSPDLDSVTRAFYERGWKGINIEPNPVFHAQLQEKRPKDINLKYATSNISGSLEMNFIENPGLSTLDEAIAKQHEKSGWGLKKREVDVTTLAEIWKQNIPHGQDIHFLKVDVEGLEEATIRGNDWNQNRPWIVLIEATLPMSQVESHQAWEPLLLESGYLFSYADGLNRFYIAEEHGDLLPAFKYPPNVFDDFVMATQAEATAYAEVIEARAQQAEANAQATEARAQRAETHAHAAEARAQHAEARARAFEARAQQAEAHAQANEERARRAEAYAQASDTRAQQAEQALLDSTRQIAALLSSRSWRMTAPLRRAANLARRMKSVIIGRRVMSDIKRHSKAALYRLGNWAMKNPPIKHGCLVIVNHMPALKSRLRRIINNPQHDMPNRSEYGTDPISTHKRHSQRAHYFHKLLVNGKR
ncbi:MAG: FkbM family methyltransferase [Pseudomonadota bacterium]